METKINYSSSGEDYVYPNSSIAYGIISASFILYTSFVILLITNVKMKLDVSAIVTIVLFEFSFLTRFIDWMVLIIKGISVGGIYYLVEFIGSDL